MDNEQWAEMPLYEEFYEISDQGRVLSLCRDQEYLRQPIATAHGYKLGLWNPDDQTIKSYWLHRMVKQAFDPLPNADAYVVVPIDKDYLNPRLSNLTWVIKAIGMVGNRSLNEAQVSEIKRLYLQDQSFTQQALAEKYGVKRGAIYKIVNGLTWGHVK